jgi:hypothetical protein
VVRYPKFRKGLVQPTLYHFLGGAHDCLMKRTLRTTKVGTKKETTGRNSYPCSRRVKKNLTFAYCLFELFLFSVFCRKRDLLSLFPFHFFLSLKLFMFFQPRCFLFLALRHFLITNNFYGIITIL